MQRMQRITGRFLPRTPNEADVEAMLKDFSDSQVMLEKLEASAKQWRDAWTNILNHQLSSVELLYAIFKPLGGEGSSSTHTHVETPADVLERVHGLHEAFSELKTDMMEEVKDIDRKLVVPAKLARDALKPMEKAIKKRDDAKVDYERYKSRCEALQNKKTRSERENHALTKHETDLERSTHAYQLADENLRERLPRLNAATFSILPHLLANQIVLQNNLIGNLYTVLHQYSHEQGYPDPPPEPEEVIPVWDSSFTPLRTEMESSLGLLKTGKAIHQPMRLPDKGETVTGLGIRNKVLPGRRPSSNDSVPTITGVSRPARPAQTLSSTSESGPPISLSNKPSYSSLSASKPKIGGSPHLSANQDAYGRRASSTSMASSYSNGGSDYFKMHPTASNGSTPSGYPSSPNPAAGKKKPPPPPPKKKIGSFQGEYVTAMYDFDSHTSGDLSFREGDRIRVVKKTESSQDWWEGEINGRQGSFPANYCK
ncbi:SH3 domain signaling protein [Pyrenophora tritici-repentis]|uniref:SH3 domain signaling protein n=2 Tax=Pyrenophora tritici-repentis TaxID=45151 RepID=A0A2W1GAN0_9PLEO|nr:SH3 domain signaling protein [Pyrenophora tritici-repentis Pt-1C-BFP]KAA8617733.1 SH3 domain-containing signal protein [Pyrenophora tritici-repentis]EDU42618.1 SH3 domain signalling protein [Pyrenophora tritici-repentis Pt-1C-BFP]KAF7443313.1 SH3 domain signaling protein [Pyrenophora tritici-repentis]KAF7568198.1 SH3 domain signaling protein [Pyrenophora tritici-repentis]KAG9376997.1 SH3 domain signaling protein [Pyrenophora tritici-repentis]